METKICPKCGALLFIDEWEGWIWRCLNCDYEGDKATAEEINELENEVWTKEEIEEAKKEAKRIQENLNWK